MDKHEDIVLNSKILASKFRELCKGFEAPTWTKGTAANLRKREKNVQLIKFLNQLSNLFQEGKCDQRAFQQEILKLKYLGLEIFWYLDVCRVISLEQLIILHEKNKNETVIKSIGNDLILKYFDYALGNSQYVAELFEKYVAVIFKSSSDDEKNTCDYFIKLILFNMKETQDFNVIPLMVLLNSLVECKSSVNKLYNKILETFLIIKQKYSMQDNFLMQQRLQDTDTKNISKLFTLILSSLDSNEILKFLNNLFLKNLNWEYLLTFISCYGTTYENGFSNLKTMVNNLLEESFQQLSINHLSFAFLIARQCCFHRISHFPSYLQWFSSTFSSESSRPINTKQTCDFFFNFLNELVECDSPYYLRIHINRVPHVPIECQPTLSDYIKFVKTKFVDLDESFELGFFENTSDKSTAEFDVEYALELFKNNNEIPHCILEASMFSRNYYEKKFLPELMGKFEGKNSVRHKFIVKLHSLGKIANSVFINYKLLNCTL